MLLLMRLVVLIGMKLFLIILELLVKIKLNYFEENFTIYINKN